MRSVSRRSQNFVTPQHLGRRVSFQWELPNGYPQEAVGILELYDAAADAYVVKNKAGDLVRIPRRDVRYGKVVD